MGWRIRKGGINPDTASTLTASTRRLVDSQLAVNQQPLALQQFCLGSLIDCMLSVNEPMFTRSFGRIKSFVEYGERNRKVKEWMTVNSDGKD